MRQTITMPQLGDTTKIVYITGWLVEVGDRVIEGQSLMSVETDKAAVEVPSPFTGTLIERLVADEDEVEPGAPIATIEM